MLLILYIFCISGSEGGAADTAAVSESKSNWCGISESLSSPPWTHQTSQETKNWTHWSSGLQNPPAGSWCSQGVRYGRPFSLWLVFLALLYLSKYCYVIFSEKNWTKLPDDWLKSLVKLFRRASAELIGQMSCGEMGYDLTRCLKKFLKVLQMISQVPF